MNNSNLQESDQRETLKMDTCEDPNALSYPTGDSQGKIVGFYTQRERLNKISHFKKKMLKRKEMFPVYKIFEGRRQSAFAKPRKWGKFVSKELGHLYFVTEEQKQQRTKDIDDSIKKKDYESAVTNLIQY